MEYESVVPSPVGPLTLRAGEHGFTALVLEHDRNRERHLSAPAKECRPGDEPPVLARARTWLEDYFTGKQPDIKNIPLDPPGTDFQKRVWQYLLTIPYGETRTYGDLAKALNSSPRAIGGAVGRNPISILIPCHRVVGSDGSLTGYAGGLEAKRFLLELESEWTKDK